MPHDSSHLVTAQAAKPLVMNLLNLASREAVENLRDACFHGGQIDGTHHDSCVRATLAKASGYSYLDLTREEVSLRNVAYCRDIGAAYEPDEKFDLIDLFFYPVRRHHTYETSDILAHLLTWCDEALDKKDALRHMVDGATDPTNVYLSAGETVGV